MHDFWIRYKGLYYSWHRQKHKLHAHVCSLSPIHPQIIWGQYRSRPMWILHTAWVCITTEESSRNLKNLKNLLENFPNHCSEGRHYLYCPGEEIKPALCSRRLFSKAVSYISVLEKKSRIKEDKRHVKHHGEMPLIQQIGELRETGDKV